MKNRKTPLLLALVTLLTLSTLLTLHAQTTGPQPSTLNTQPTLDPSFLHPLLDGLAGKYGFLTTVLLAIGSLRILFKPVMLVVENALKNDPAKYAAVQKFEAG